ncbi:MAG: hypothetical protein ACK5NB_03340 [Flavobacteriaceae bacterium]
MKKSIPFITFLFILITSCNSKPGPFEISKQHIGALTDSTQIKDLKTIFAQDSVVKFSAGETFANVRGSIEVFEKGGKKLLVLTPENDTDSLSVIESVQIIDPRYKTNKNITTLSTFKDIETNYTISKIDNLINSIVVTVKEINASFVIDKKELPANLRFDRNLKFETTHIPDNAKIKYFFLNWNK